MKRLCVRWIGLLLIGMLIASALSLTSCASQAVVIPADRMVRPLSNGNYEVSAAWLQERYQYEMWLKQQLEECKK
jgi:hypothetical protein